MLVGVVVVVGVVGAVGVWVGVVVLVPGVALGGGLVLWVDEWPCSLSWSQVSGVRWLISGSSGVWALTASKS